MKPKDKLLKVPIQFHLEKADAIALKNYAEANNSSISRITRMLVKLLISQKIQLN